MTAAPAEAVKASRVIARKSRRVDIVAAQVVFTNVTVSKVAD